MLNLHGTLKGTFPGRGSTINIFSATLEADAEKAETSRNFSFF